LHGNRGLVTLVAEANRNRQNEPQKPTEIT